MNLPEGPVLGLNPTGALVWSLLEEKDEDGLVRARERVANAGHIVVEGTLTSPAPLAHAPVVNAARAAIAITRDWRGVERRLTGPA